MPAGLYTRWEFETEMKKFKARHNLSRNFENMVMFFYQKQRPECKFEIFFSDLENTKKLSVLMWTVIVITVKQCSKHWDVNTTYVPVQKLFPP